MKKFIASLLLPLLFALPAQAQIRTCSSLTTITVDGSECLPVYNGSNQMGKTTTGAIAALGGGGGTWGTITGTLSDQTDLQDALDLKFDSADFNLSTFDTDDLAEGLTNLYYDDALVSANSDVAANTAARHAAVTLAGEDYLSLSGQQITANEIDENNLSASVNTSLDLADSSIQPGDNISDLVNDAGYITGNQTITLSGDVTGSGTTAITATLANTTVTPATYGGLNSIPVLAVDSKGRITSASNSAVVFPLDRVVGPSSATDNAIMRFDGTGGKNAQNSGVIISDTDAVSGITQLDVDNLRLDGNTISSTNTNGNLTLAPNGTGNVGIANAAITGGAINGTSIGASTRSTGAFGGASNYASFSSGGNLIFFGLAQYLLNLDTFAFAVNGLPNTGIKFRFLTGVPGYVATDTIGVDVASLDMSGFESYAHAPYGFSSTSQDVTALAANTNNWNILSATGGRVRRISASSAVDVTGIAKPTNNRGVEIILDNTGANAITLKHLSGSSLSTSQFRLQAGADRVVQPQGTAGSRVFLWWDTQDQKWHDL